MNSFLAEMYGTRETIGAPNQGNDDVEKLAEAQLLDEALRAENIDVDSLSPEAIVKVAQALFGEDSKLVKAASVEGEKTAEGEGEGEAEGDKENKEEKDEKEAEGETAEEKMAQADFLGRVMAHSFVQEQAEIAKEAAAKEAGIKDIAGKGLSAAKAGLTHLKNAPGAAKGAVKGKAEAMAHSFHKGVRAGTRKGMEHPSFKGLSTMVKEHPKTVAGLGAGAVSAAGGAAYGGHKLFHKGEKSASALDVLAEQRALEILEQNGVGQDEDTKLASAVEQRAWEMLAEQGYVKDEE